MNLTNEFLKRSLEKIELLTNALKSIRDDYGTEGEDAEEMSNIAESVLNKIEDI